MLTQCINCTEPADSASTDSASLKKKTFNDENTPLTIPELSTGKGETELHSDGGREATLFTDKMISGSSALLKNYL